MLDRSGREPENSGRIERVILVIYIFYALCMVISMPVYREPYVLLLQLFGLAVCIWMHVRRYRSYVFRSYATMTVIWLNLFLYALYTDDFTGIQASAATVVSLQAVYFLPEIFRVGNVFYTGMIAAHLFFLRDLRISLSGDGMRVLLRFLSVYLIAGIAHYFVKLQQESNQRLLTNIESLRRAEHSKDDFLANVSHEIRTPVNTICGMSDILLQGELPEEARENVSGIQTAGRNLYALVSDILDFSELQSGDITILQDTYKITSVVNDLIHIASAKNEEKNLELIVDCDPDLPDTLVGDRQKICHAVMNVMDNAIKFTESGGVLLTVTSRKEDYGVNLCITVRDTGIGILPENLEKIFTSFNQVDTRRSRADGGIGLGLAISRMLVEKMGGFLNIRSVYGEGTEVVIAIPQGVENETPCISVRNPEQIRCLVYMRLDLQKSPVIRDGYRESMSHIGQKFGIPIYFCGNLAEVKRRLTEDSATHLFVGDQEYEEEPDWFEKMAGQMSVIRIIGANSGKNRKGSRLRCIYGPFYSLTIAAILNGGSSDQAAGAAQNPFIAPSVQILVVDDNRMNLRVVQGLLRPYQIRVSTAQSGQEALKLLESKAFDFVFMDHMMPEMDGVETFRRIREKPDAYFQNVPVIALTANAVGNAREMFLAEGFADYVSKPIEPSALDHVLRKFIPEEKMAAREETESPKTGRDREKTGTDGQQTPQAGGSTGKTDAAPCRIQVQAGLAYAGGNREDYLEILKIYHSGGEKQIRALQKACKERNWEQVRLLAHTIKGTSASIGAAGLAEMAAELENFCREGRFAEAEERAGGVLDEYEKVLQEIREDPALSPAGQSQDPQPVPEPDAEEKQKREPQTGNAEGRELTGLEFAACCRRLEEKLNSFDSEIVEAYLKRVGRDRYHGRSVEELLEPVVLKAREFDFLGAEEALARILEREREV